MESAILKQIERQVKNCQKCRLYRTRTNTVPGEGPAKIKVAFVGEAPGFNEDKEGRPFVGRAGKLLEELLVMIKLTRDQVWIGNIIKCRPPDNREPHVDELRNCAPYLDLQLKELNPPLICTLGRFAAAHFISDVKISEDRGKPRKIGRFTILPLYHPAAALRSPKMEQALREDFRVIPKILSGQIKVESVNHNGNDDQMALL